MESQTTVSYIVLVGYILFNLAVATYLSRYIKKTEDYLLGGRRLGSMLVAAGVLASQASGFWLFGTGGMRYRLGIAALIPGLIIGTIPTIIYWFKVGPMIRKFSVDTNSLSVPDMLEARYYDEEKHTIRIISAVVIFICMIVYTGALTAQIAKIFKWVFGWPLWLAVAIGYGLQMYETLSGGFLAEAYTDLIDSLVMTVTFVIFLFVAVTSIPYSQVVTTLDQVAVTDPRFGIVPTLTASSFALVWGVTSLANTFAVFGQPQLLSKFMAAKSKKVFRKALIMYSIASFIWTAALIVGGSYARVVYPEYALLPGGDTELAIPALISKLLGPVFTSVALAAIVTASVSTADGVILTGVTAIVNDIYYKIINPKATDKQLLKYSKICTVILYLLSILVAFQPEMILFMTWFPWTGLFTFAMILPLGIWWKRMTKEGAICGLITGFFVNIAWYYLAWNKYPIGIHTALAVAFFTIIVSVGVSLVTKPPPDEIVELCTIAIKG